MSEQVTLHITKDQVRLLRACVSSHLGTLSRCHKNDMKNLTGTEQSHAHKSYHRCKDRSEELYDLLTEFY